MAPEKEYRVYTFTNKVNDKLESVVRQGWIPVSISSAKSERYGNLHISVLCERG